MLISKKDLLRETGISYGQLYRWKREGLIPEEWFIKQPSFTGQETFFPKNKILNRIRVINELKDKYSLEELAKLLSPEVSVRAFTPQDLAVIEEIPKDMIPHIVSCFEKESFTFIETLIIIALSQWACEKKLIGVAALARLCAGARGIAAEVKQSDKSLSLLRSSGGEYFTALYSDSSDVRFDSNLEIIDTKRLSELSSMVKIKYRGSFGFRLDDENVADEPEKAVSDGKLIGEI